jgi:hypothetical protein
MGKSITFIANALEYGEQDYTLDQIKVYLASGNWALIVALNEIEEVAGACTVTFINYPNDRVAFVTSIGGKLDLVIKKLHAQFKTILKNFGATKIQGAARKSSSSFMASFRIQRKIYCRG